MIRVGVVDDRPAVLDTVVGLLGAEPDVRVVGSCRSSASARELVASGCPDVAVIAESLEDGRGIDLCREITSSSSTRVVVWNGAGSDGRVRAAGAGAAAVADETQPIRDLVAALRTAARMPVRAPIHGGSPRWAGRAGRTPRLTQREVEVAKLLLEGFTTPEMAEVLRIRPATVKGHVDLLVHKLGARNRVHAAALLAADRTVR